MFAKLKKKIAEETAVAQRPGGTNRIPRSVSKESVASMGADSGDDFVSIVSCFEYLMKSVIYFFKYYCKKLFQQKFLDCMIILCFF